MIKKIYAIAIVALALGTWPAYSQEPVKNLERLEATCPGKSSLARAECKEAVMAQRPCRAGEGLFKGIELTADQKAKIDKLESKSRKECGKQAAKARKERAKKMEKRQKEMAKILTPAQYEIYKANARALGQSCHKDKTCKDACKKGGKHGKHGKCRKADSKQKRGGCCGQACGKRAEKRQG